MTDYLRQIESAAQTIARLEQLVEVSPDQVREALTEAQTRLLKVKARLVLKMVRLCCEIGQLSSGNTIELGGTTYTVVDIRFSPKDSVELVVKELKLEEADEETFSDWDIAQTDGFEEFYKQLGAKLTSAINRLHTESGAILEFLARLNDGTQSQ